MPPGEQLVEHDPEREDVCAHVHGLGLHLLGRHVGGRADEGRLGGGGGGRVGALGPRLRR
jgi:hypothetical protein